MIHGRGFYSPVYSLVGQIKNAHVEEELVALRDKGNVDLRDCLVQVPIDSTALIPG
jgi:hypothetical protein